MIEHLTAQGVIPASSLYDSPFTDIRPRGPDGQFSPGEIHELVSVLDFVHLRAVAKGSSAAFNFLMDHSASARMVLLQLTMRSAR